MENINSQPKSSTLKMVLGILAVVTAAFCFALFLVFIQEAFYIFMYSKASIIKEFWIMLFLSVLALYSAFMLFFMGLILLFNHRIVPEKSKRYFILSILTFLASLSAIIFLAYLIYISANFSLLRAMFYVQFFVSLFILVVGLLCGIFRIIWHFKAKGNQTDNCAGNKADANNIAYNNNINAHVENNNYPDNPKPVQIQNIPGKRIVLGAIALFFAGCAFYSFISIVFNYLTTILQGYDYSIAAYITPLFINLFSLAVFGLVGIFYVSQKRIGNAFRLTMAILTIVLLVISLVNKMPQTLSDFGELINPYSSIDFLIFSIFFFINLIVFACKIAFGIVLTVNLFRFEKAKESILD